MAISPRARPYLLITAVALLVAGLLVVRLPDGSDTARESPTAPAPASTPAVVGQRGGAGAGDPYYPEDGNTGYDVAGYDVSIGYDPATGHLDGVARVTARATADLVSFNLDLRGLEVSSVEVGGEGAGFAREGEQELVITPATPLAEGAEFTAVVAYSGEPQSLQDPVLGTNGWQRSESGGAFAAGEPHSATTWYPANDTPRDKASFALSARVPDGWSAVSIGLERGSTSEGGWTAFRWEHPEPVATYLTTVAVDRWEFERGELPDGTPVVNAYAPGAEAARAHGRELPSVLAFLADRFGPYPFDAAGGIYLADRIGFSLETQTRPIYAAWADLETVVHENAHQWFGDAVTIKSWADICLNECFASYSTWLWAESLGADLDADYRAEVEKWRGNTGYWSRKLYDMGRGNEFRGVYDKGQLAVHALRARIGDEAFDRVLKSWVSEHLDANASWPEFEAHVQRVSGQDLSAFFQAWFRGGAIPADEHLWPGGLRG
ncbi:M1 family metallopeptidase [Actinosynnema sp.]|uniref:M1 family metallopeptidase n=1 Tax=Actinosynnema sp. TaxID=1872144 RepID=UPI003F85DE6C